VKWKGHELWTAEENVKRIESCGCENAKGLVSAAWVDNASKVLSSENEDGKTGVALKISAEGCSLVQEIISERLSLVCESAEDQKNQGEGTREPE
jgi:hypothetical protein